MIRFRCAECGKKLKAEEEIVGRKVKCTRCGRIETVPGAGDLAKPEAPDVVPDTVDPKTNRFKSDPLAVFESISIDLDEPIELDQPMGLAADSKPPAASSIELELPFGSSSEFDSSSGLDESMSPLVNLDRAVEFSGVSVPDSSAAPAINVFEPRFQAASPKTSSRRRWLLAGFIGVFVFAVVALVFGVGWLMEANRRMSIEYEKLAEVVYYRNAVMNLQKSCRMLNIAGKNHIATRGGTEEELQELLQYNSSVVSLIDSDGVLREVEELFRAGKDQRAKALLVNTAVELNKKREEVESRTREYTQMSGG